MERLKKGLSFLLILAMLVSVCIPLQAEAAAKPKINKTKQTMYIGQTMNLKVTGTTQKVTWSTSNKKVATVSTKGKVTAKKKGTATITAKVSNKKYTCKVTVKAPKLSATSKKLDIGKTYTLKLTGATAKSYSSSNQKIATVDRKGKITAKKTGKATITVKDTKGRKYTCKITVNKCTHTWDSGKITKKATCTTTGVKTYTCKTCKATKTEKLAKTSHNKGDWEVTKKAICDEDGTEVRRCTVCKEILESRIIPYLGHDYEKLQTVAPTCTERGYTIYMCDCGEMTETDYEDALGHDWGEWATTKEPTETEVGEKTRECSRCEETETEEISVTIHEHAYESVVTVPTCTEQGYTTHTCKCGDSYVDTYVDATGHSYEATVTVPTCTEQGYTTHTCACGDSYKDTYVDALDHDWGEWKTTKEPTEEEFGEETRSCVVCGATETNSLPKKEHEHSYTESVVTEPTCTEQGYTTHTCKCGDSYKDTYVDAKGHSYEDSVTAPTCNAQGYTTHTCACGDAYTDTYVEVDDNAHVAGEWVTTKEATYIEVGTKTKSCTVCGQVLETEEIPVLELTNGDAVYTIELAGGATDYVVGHYDTELAAELVALVNAYRAENGLTELDVTDFLQDKANIRGYQTSYYWEHRTPAGQSPTALYSYSAENLAWYVTRTSALEIFNALKDCEDHNAIMLSTYSKNRTAASVFCKRVGENDYEYYWVQIFK